MEIVKISKQTFEELLGSLAAFSITNGGSPYIDRLVERAEKEVEDLKNE